MPTTKTTPDAVTIDPTTANRADLTAFLKAMGQYSGLSQAPIAKLREVAAHALRVQAKQTANLEEALAASPPAVATAIEVTDVKTRQARVDAAKAESKALRAWERDGSRPPRPATPNLDALNADFAVGGAGKTRKAAKAKAERPVKITGVTPPPPGKLALGSLGPLCLEAVTKATEPVTASEVAKVLGRSAGAVNNALAKLAADGTLRLASDTPRRYEVAPAKGRTRKAS